MVFRDLCVFFFGFVKIASALERLDTFVFRVYVGVMMDACKAEIKGIISGNLAMNRKKEMRVF